MKRYIKPASILIKMDQQPLLAGTNWDRGYQISGKDGDQQGGIIDQTGSEVGGGSAFAKKNFMPFDDADDNMDW